MALSNISVILPAVGKADEEDGRETGAYWSVLNHKWALPFGTPSDKRLDGSS